MKNLLLFALLTLPFGLQAELTLPNFFSDHMVLQRESDAAIWGNADANQQVTVSFKGKTATAKADAKGAWRTTVTTGKADATGSDLNITAGDKSVVIKDVLVGEVWFASGQSNMAFNLRGADGSEEAIAKANIPTLRTFNAAMTPARDPQTNIEGSWTACTPENCPSYSAVAFFFSRKLSEDLDIPIGMIKSAWGGKPVETFTSREALNTLPATKALVDAVIQQDAVYDAAQAMKLHEKRMADYTQAMAERKKSKDPKVKAKRLRRPNPPKAPLETEGKPGVLFNGMIHPFAGYTLRGAIWYQGEANAKPNSVPYDQTLPLMINDWRTRWGSELSFYFVQLANFRNASTQPGTPDSWALCQDRMRLILNTTPKTGMAIINDIGAAKDIHPKNKKDVGERLARWALAKDYGKKVIISGPLYQSHTITKGNVLVTFDHSGTGLRSRDDQALQRFEIAGADKKWHWADAKVSGKNQVALRSDAVKKPVAVRYAWAANPEGANLVNSDGLPASIFRTDDWSDVVDHAAIQAEKVNAQKRALSAKMKALLQERAKLEKNSDAYKAKWQAIQKLREQIKALDVGK